MAAMTRGDLLKLLEREAKSYRKEALESVSGRNRHMNELSTLDIQVMNEIPERFQRFADAILVDFINLIGNSQGLDYGLYVKDLDSPE